MKCPKHPDPAHEICPSCAIEKIASLRAQLKAAENDNGLLRVVVEQKKHNKDQSDIYIAALEAKLRAAEEVVDALIFCKGDLEPCHEDCDDLEKWYYSEKEENDALRAQLDG